MLFMIAIVNLIIYIVLIIYYLLLLCSRYQIIYDSSIRILYVINNTD